VSRDPFSPEDREALARASAAVAAGGAVVASAGNLSVRRGDHVLITKRNARLAAVVPSECVCVALADGAVHPSHGLSSEPSSEAELHRLAYQAVPGAGAVVHTHSHFATVLSTLVDEIPAVHYATTAFGGPVRVAPYAVFGSPELATNVEQALQGRRAALMANHGAVVVGDDLTQAVELAELLEWLASVAWHAMVAGKPALLDRQALADVDRQRVRLRYAEAA
jgi:L-fuculose-phosphate aldolase